MILVEWILVASLYLFKPNQLKLKTPISDFLKINSTQLVFILGFILVSLLFYIFVHKYLVKVLKTPVNIFDLALFCLIVALLVPYNTWGHSVHVIGASLFVILFFMGALITGYRNRQRYVRNISVLVIGSVILSLMVSVAIKGLQAILLFELIIGVFGQAWIFLISLRSFK